MKSLKLKRGTTGYNDTYIGRDGEVTLDVERRVFRIHDGVTPGGEEVGGGAGGVDGPIALKGILESIGDIPEVGEDPTGTAYVVQGDYWVIIDGQYKNIGTVRGPEGLSAYEVAVQSGYYGSLEKWLESLRGADGIGLRVLGERRIVEELPPEDNFNGDAYIVQRVMWVWVNSRWVEVGQVGPRGESAFQLAKEQKLIPDTYTLNEYLESLKGKDAYTIAVEEGTIPADWSRLEWVADLQGRDAYELAVYGGYTGSIDEWFDTLRGERGVQGERGQQGPRGEPSNAIQVIGRVNSVEALPTGRQPGDSYYVNRDLHVFNGDEYMNVGPVVGEKGDRGIQGPQGPVGDVGPNGDSAYTVAVREAAFSGTPRDWVNSLNGKSAYELAREIFGGTIGTEAEWLTSLYGADAYETAVQRGQIDSIEEARDYFRGPEGPMGVQGPVGDGLTIKGRVSATSQLPTRDIQNYDVYAVEDSLYIFENAEWFYLGSFRGLRILGSLEQAADLPEIADVNDGYLIGYDLYVLTEQGWENAGPVRGPTGPQGLTGEQGLQGLRGEIGPQGAQGPKGERGETGPEGPTGPEGQQGNKGEAGSGITIVGTVASPDDLPSTGNLNEGYLIERELWINPTGSEWVNAGLIQGPTGEKGEKGERGPIGISGTDGAQGAEGHSVRILGLLETESQLPSGMKNGDGYLIGPDLHVNVNGAWRNVGPVRGPEGPQGISGEKGDTGEDGYGVRYISRLGSESELPSSAETRDAYIINSRVFSWSGTEWIDLGELAGPKGDQGERGAQGPTGQRGDQGPVGRDGRTGPRGAKGARGDKGPSGPKGEVGPEGPAGRGIAIAGELDQPLQLPGNWNTPDSGYVIDGDLWLYEPIMSKWFNAGPIVGPQGDVGPLGPKGDAGIPGDEGARGPRGSIWINAPREPTAIDGSPGDYFINTTSRVYYTKLDAIEWLALGTLDGTGFIDAPVDGRRYVRRNGVWAEVEVSEAPADGNYYTRRNERWAKAPVGLIEAPDDGKAYVRKSKEWAPASVVEAPADGEPYVRQNGAWKQIDRYTVKSQASDGILDLSKSQVFTLSGNENLNVILDKPPEAGRSMTVVLTINGGAGMITWPSSVNWNRGLPPMLGTTHTVVVLLWTGSIWIGSVGITI